MAPRSAALLLLVSLSASTCLAGMDCSAAQAGQEECAADAGADSGSLMQVRRARLQGEGLQGSGGDEAAAWVADSFGPCLEDCGPMRFRDVTCRSVYEDAALPPGACTLAKPATAKSCNCGVVVCEKAAGGQCPQASTAADSAPAGPVEVGCYSTASLALEPGEPLMPLACENWTGAGPCSGGLPFYRLGDAAMSLGKCEAFCLGKGLDVFGIESGIACRCGASALNHAIWHEEKPRPGLAFDPGVLEPSTATACPLKVYRYGGHYESGGVPRAYWNFLEGDLEYTDSIVQGRAIDEGTEEDGSPPEGAMPDALAQAEGDLKYNPNDPTFERPCWPGNCGPGNGPWRTRSTAAPPGVQDVWKEYVLIDYWYEPGLDAKRKEAFEAAAEVWRNSTCINLVERSQKPSGAHYIKVGAYDTGSCYLSGMGWPSSWASAINLGWCNDLRYLGNMVHEIGHALGMNHEQKRPDATQKYHGHGPFLKIFWENVPSGWVYQYTADEGSYTGSADDGVGDPHAGYADYDFESIMHYSGGSRFDTIPADKERVLGNRLHLTQGDINQINDIYQCVPKPPCAGPDCPTPAPTPAPPPPTPAPPAAYELRSSGHCAKSVATLPECERAASALSLSDTTAEDDGQNFGAGYDPPFCYFEGNSLKFNADGSNAGPCSEADRCLCSLVPTPAPTPAPPARASGACSFEALETSGSFCGLWRQGTQDTFDWTRKDGSTPSYGTGPSSAADGSYYIFIETSDPRLPGDTAVLESPPLIIDGPTAMSFQYHMHGRDVGSLKVRVKGGAEADAKEVWSKAGQVGDRWESATVSLDAYNGSTAQISFVAERGAGWEGDIAIDNVAFQASAPPATSTAAPTPSPTPSPTLAPTTATTVAPTPSPMSPPTLAPTPSPTPLPTPSPTSSPTPRPTPSPTPLPTPSPTPLPTPSQTPRPTPSPTPLPTPSPTPQPTPSPTPLPTPSPTPLPTPSPTPRPTPSPTPRPTPSPTPSPTPARTPSPTPAPTAAPTPATPSPASGPSYERRTSGTCEQRIKTAAECGAAAAALGFASTTAHDDLQPDGVSYDPPYCYYEGGLLKFNAAGRNTGACSDFDVCLCSLGPTPAPTLAPTIPALGSCGFEHNATALWCGRWFNVQGEDQFDWLPLQGETPSYGTGPPHAYEGQQYVYMEASYPRASGQTAILRTVPLSVSGPIVMKFHYYMYGGDMGSLQVLVRKTSEAHVQEAWKVQGDQGDAWKTATVDLEPYVGSDVEVSLVGEVGSSYRSDIAIDSVAFEEE